MLSVYKRDTFKYGFGLNIMILYLILSPIYWLPGLPHQLIKYLKIILIVIVLFDFFNKSKGVIKLPNSFKIPIWVTALWFVPFIFFSNQTDDLLQLIIFYSNYFFGFLIGVLAFNKYDQIVNNTKKLIYVFIGVSLLCLFPISNYFFGFPDWLSPFAIEMGTERLDVFWSTGFHGSRTGWSIVLSEFVPFSLLFIKFNNNARLKLKHLIIILILLAPIVGAQIICMGRGGLLGSIISLLIILFKLFSKRIYIFFIAASCLLIFSFINYISVALRIADAKGKKLSLNEVSASRDKLIQQAPGLIQSSLIFGNGYKGSVVSGRIIKSDEENLEIHNVFIRMFVDHGIIFGFVILVFIIYLLFNCFKILRTETPPIIILIAICIIVSGIASANFEPNTIFGNFQNLPFWWISVGLLLFYKSNITNVVSNNQKLQLLGIRSNSF